MISIDEYQNWTDDVSIYPEADMPFNFAYPALGLAGEAGEVADVVKKFIRDGLPDQWRAKITDELGDVLFYLARVAKEGGIKLSEVLERNVQKLSDRKARGVIKGSGNNR